MGKKHPNDSNNFDSDWIEDNVFNWQENTRIDFKEKIYEVKKSQKEEEQFVRHLVAFANTARRINAACWMFFGIDENDREHPKDVIKQYASKDPPFGWDNPARSNHAKQNDGVLEVYRNVAQDFIGPCVPDFDLEFGMWRETFISYLVIKPAFSSSAFFLNKKLGNHTIGKVFVRSGSSSVALPTSEVPYLLPFKEVGYLQSSDWSELLKSHTTLEFEQASILQPAFEVKIEGKDNEAFQNVIEQLDVGVKTVIVKGQAGEGKTTLLRRMAEHLARKHDLDRPTLRRYFGENESDILPEKLTVSNNLEVVPFLPIPIYFPLRAAFSSVNELEFLFVTRINLLLGTPDRFTTLRSVLNIPGSTWIFLLDGIDEIRNRNAAGPIFHEWLKLLPSNVQFVISSRPYALPHDLSETKELLPVTEFHLKLLSKEEILYLITGKISSVDPEQPENLRAIVNEFIDSNSGLYNLLNRLRAIDAFVNYYTDGRFLLSIKRIKRDTNPISGLGNKVQSIGEGNIQAISIDDFESDSYLSTNILSPDVSNNLAEPSLSLALAIEKICDTLNELEAERQSDIGCNRDDIANKAFFALGKLAWKSNWETNSFNADCLCEKGLIQTDELEWNLYVGFILLKKYPYYSYYTEILHRYLIAKFFYTNMEFVEDEFDIHIFNTRCFARLLSLTPFYPFVKRHRINRSALLKEITLLINDLCIYNGRPPYVVI